MPTETAAGASPCCGASACASATGGVPAAHCGSATAACCCCCLGAASVGAVLGAVRASMAAPSARESASILALMRAVCWSVTALKTLRSFSRTPASRPASVSSAWRCWRASASALAAARWAISASAARPALWSASALAAPRAWVQSKSVGRMLMTCCIVGVPEAALSIEASGSGAARLCTLCALWCVCAPPTISEATSAAVLAPMLASADDFWKFWTGTPLYRLPRWRWPASLPWLPASLAAASASSL